VLWDAVLTETAVALIRQAHPDLARAGLRGCREPGDNWRATVYIASGSAAILVNPPGDAASAAAAEAALRGDGGDAYTIVTRASSTPEVPCRTPPSRSRRRPATRWDSAAAAGSGSRSEGRRRSGLAPSE
jgi:hypothetical protein